MNPKAIGVAAVAGLVGALVWGGIAYAIDFEIGYVAWGIGLIVGIGARMGGGQGQPIAVVCALLALGSIFFGKVMAVEFSKTKAVEEIKADFAESLTEEAYDKALAEAEAASALEEDVAFRKFMFENDYTEAAAADDITNEELSEFKEEALPALLDIHMKQPTYAEWREDTLWDYSVAVDEFFASFSTVDSVWEDLGAMDVLFALLGLGTAYKVALGEDE